MATESPVQPAEPTELDLSAAYRVDGYGGVAWRIIGYAMHTSEPEWECFEHGHSLGSTVPSECDETCEDTYSEPEPEPDHDHVRAVMVGDDRVFTFGRDEVTAIDDDSYCAECGQIGCAADGRDRG